VESIWKTYRFSEAPLTISHTCHSSLLIEIFMNIFLSPTSKNISGSILKSRSSPSPHPALLKVNPFLIQEQYGKKFEYFKSDEQAEKEQHILDAQAEDTTKLHKKTP
jgi:hypothetical protein